MGIFFSANSSKMGENGGDTHFCPIMINHLMTLHRFRVNICQKFGSLHDLSFLLLKGGRLSFWIKSLFSGNVSATKSKTRVSHLAASDMKWSLASLVLLVQVGRRHVPVARIFPFRF